MSNSLLAKFRIGVWAVVAIAALVGVALLLGEMQRDYGRSGSSPGAFRVSGDYELTAQNGERFSSKSLAGHPHLVFFGFTHCPDICPTTLQEVSLHLQELGEKAKDIIAVFISVDPARDTPENLASYLSAFDSRIVGLTGSDDEIKRVAKLYRAFYEKIPGSSDGDYSMNHTASVYLFDRTGKLVSTLNWQEPADARRKKLELLVSR